MSLKLPEQKSLANLWEQNDEVLFIAAIVLEVMGVEARTFAISLLLLLMADFRLQSYPLPHFPLER